MQTEEMFSLLLKEIKGVRRDMQAGFEQVDMKFEQVDKRFEQADKRFEQMDSKFEQKLEQVEQKLRIEMQTGFTLMEQRFDRMEESQQADVVGMLNVINNKVDRMAYDIDYLRNESSKHDMDIARLKKQVEGRF